MIWLLGITAAFAADDSAFGTLQAYGNFHSGGIVVFVNGDDNRDASVTLEWRPHGVGAFRPGHPLIRAHDDHDYFTGSLFWLKPGKIYEVRATLTDPDGVSGKGPDIGAREYVFSLVPLVPTLLLDD